MYMQKLFNYMHDEHDVILLESDMFQIIDIVKEIIFEASDESLNVRDDEGKKESCTHENAYHAHGWRWYCPDCMQYTDVAK